jgi:putative transposase
MRRGARAELSDISPELWSVAKARERVLRPLIRDGGRPEAAAIVEAAKQLGVSVQWTRSLLRRFIADPRTSVLLPDSGGRPRGLAILDARVEAVIAERIRTHYATPQRPPFGSLIAAIAHECRRQGLAVPVPRTVRRRLRAADPVAILAGREGGKVARARLGPVKARFEPASRPLQLVQIDHTPADLIIVDEIHREPIGRPWLTLAIDVFSRVIAGYYVSLEAPSSLSVALCLAHVVTEKAPWLARLGIEASWPSGLPEAVHLDNAAEFHAAALVRGCEEHGIAISYRPVATPHYGGHVERLVGPAPL